MERRRQVVLYGNSVILGTLAASLGASPQFEVISVSPVLPDYQALKDLTPDVILFDIEATHPEAAFALLEKLPGLMLIGVSPDANLVKVWSGKQLRELSTKDLIGLIDHQLGDAHVPK